MGESLPIPDAFCWTRFGTEAGQSVARILDRKERERRAGHGVFLWGIGNAVGPGIRELVRRCIDPEVLFSPIKSEPRVIDMAPQSVVAWTTGETLDGDFYSLPDNSLVTSRYSTEVEKRAHYALVCFSTQPLGWSDLEPSLAFSRLRNLRSGRPLGASQVTAVVMREPNSSLAKPTHSVAFRAHLVHPYFIRLQGPVPIEVDPESHVEQAAM